MNKTKELLISMLKENTGKALGDSGGAYGRNWERNQDVDFESEPKITIDDYGITVSLYHYLSELLEVDDLAAELNKYVDKINEGAKDSNGWVTGDYIHWTGDMLDHLFENKEMYKFCQHFSAKHNTYGLRHGNNIHSLAEILFQGEPNKVSDTHNSYNGECFLSQTIQYFTVALENDDVYIFLQIHGGCDVRGGYTDGRWFKLNGYLEWTPSIHARIDGVDLDTYYNGYGLTISDTEDNKEKGLTPDEEFELTENMNVEYAEWNGIDESMTYIYSH